MRRILASALRPGMTFEQALFTRYGAKVLPAGRPLTREMWRRLVAGRADRPMVLCLAESPIDLPEALPPTDVREPLPPVEEPAAAAPDAEWDSVCEGCERSVSVRRIDAENAVEAASARLDALPRRVVPERSIDAGSTRPYLSGGIDPEGSIEALRGVLTRLGDGCAVDAAPILVCVDDLSDLAVRSPGALAGAALRGLPQEGGNGIAPHAWRVGALAVAVARGLGWGASDVRTVGAAALLADVGMSLVGSEPATRAADLDERTMSHVRRHAAFSAGILAAGMRVPEEVLLTVWQHHERDDGSGYPRGQRASRIVDTARVIGLVDTFLAAASDRPHRRGAEPHHALRAVMELARRGVLWEAATVRLVRLVGLYPIGSRVRLTCDESGTVVAVPDPSLPHRPIVEVRVGTKDVRRIDLSREGEDVKIACAMPAPRGW